MSTSINATSDQGDSTLRWVWVGLAECMQTQHNPKESTYKIYPDDTAIHITPKTDIENAVSDLQVDPNNLKNWCKMNEIW